MKNLKNLVAAITLFAILVLSTTSANAGIYMTDLTGTPTTDPCTAKDDDKVDWGILMGDFTGIIVAGFTGIIVAGRGVTPPTSQVDCGIILGD